MIVWLIIIVCLFIWWGPVAGFLAIIAWAAIALVAIAGRDL